MTRRRADILLVEKGLFDSRAKARAAIEAGGVTAAGRVVAKASELIEADAPLEAHAAHRFVGRGGLKLEAALALWPVQVEGRVVADIGASTGGFTQLCLECGAARVYAVDVGHGQLHPTLAGDSRVVDLSGTDARRLDAEVIPQALELIVTDVSFISLAKALPAALALARPGADLVALVKPQFEAGREHVGKGGLVRDPAVRERTVAGVRAFLDTAGWDVRATAESPVVGGEGAVEHLLWATRRP